METKHADLFSVRSELEALAFQRTACGLLSPEDKVKYRELCLQEASLLGLVHAA